MADFITTKANGDTLDASEWNQLAEIDNAIDSSGLTLTTAQTDQLKISMSRYSSGSDFYTDGGSANAYVLTSISHGGGKSFAPAGSGAVNYFNGMRVRFRPANNNSGASTINVSSFGLKDIRKSNGTTALSGGELTTTRDVILRYDSTNNCFIIQEYDIATTTNQGVAYLNNPITITNNATNPNTQMDIGAGIVDYDNGSGQLLCQAMTKTLQSSGSWTAGNNQNGLDTGARANSTWYNIFQIVKNSDNTSDILYSTSRTAPNVPSGYTLVAWIGRMRTDASGNIDPNQYSIRTSYGQLHHYRNPNFASGTTTIPFDNTTPQNTEGTEFMTTNFVPIKAFSKIEIDCNMFVAISLANVANLNALFKSGNANALTVGYSLSSSGDGGQQTTLKYVDTLSSTSAVDYSVRCGGSSASTVYFNGISSGARFNGTFYSSITIKEYL